MNPKVKTRGWQHSRETKLRCREYIFPKNGYPFLSWPQEEDGGGVRGAWRKVRRSLRSLSVDPLGDVPAGSRLGSSLYFCLLVFKVLLTQLNRVDRLVWGTLMLRDPNKVPLGPSSLDSVC